MDCVHIFNLNSTVEAVKNLGAAKIHVADNPCFTNYLSASYAEALQALATSANACFVAAGTTSTTKDLLPRFASKWNAAMASDILEIVNATQFKRPMWAGNVIATIELTTDNKVATTNGDHNTRIVSFAVLQHPMDNSKFDLHDRALFPTGELKRRSSPRGGGGRSAQSVAASTLNFAPLLYHAWCASTEQDVVDPGFPGDRELNWRTA